MRPMALKNLMHAFDYQDEKWELLANAHFAYPE